MSGISGKPTLGDAIASLRLLASELGWIRALTLGSAITSERNITRLFASLPPADSDRERASRQQAGPAILLYRALTEEKGQEFAFSLTSRVIEQGALRFLGRILGDMRAADFAQLPAADQQVEAKRWIDAFFTAESRLDDVASEQVVFTVTACALHRLATASGHPELAPAFCAADGKFLAERDPPIYLHRPTTLARGDSDCRFELKLTQS